MAQAIKKVLANCEQSFSDAEKAQARSNIGAAAEGSQIPSFTSGDARKTLCVNQYGDGIEWGTRMSGNAIVSDGQGSTTTQELQNIRVNLSGGNDGLVRVRPEGGSNMIAGWLAPDTFAFLENAGYYLTPIVDGNGYPKLSWRKDPMDIEQLEKVTRTYATTTTVELNIEPGKWYECTVDDNNVIVRIALETNSTDTVHTIIVVKADTSASTSWANLDYFIENSTARYIACDLSSTSSNPTARIFDVYIKGGFRVNNIPRSFCRVRELEPSSLVTPPSP